MVDIASISAGYEEKDVVDAIYYAARIIKQAVFLRKNEKNVFADDKKSEPSVKAIDLSNKIVSAIEKEVGKKISYFDDKTARDALEELFSFSKKLFVSSISSAEAVAVDDIIRSLIEPQGKE